MLSISEFPLISLVSICITAVASEKYEVDLWRYEAGKLIPEEMDKIESPGEACYIIIQRQREEKVRNWKVYYFLPKVDAKYELLKAVYNTAALAVSMNYEFRAKTRVRREVEGRESANFKELFPNLKYKESGAENEFATWQTKKVFKITQENKDKPLIINMTEIPIHLTEVFAKGNFCLVCALDDVYVFCRLDATERERMSARELAKILLKRREQPSDDVVNIALRSEIVSKGRLGFDEFVERFQEASETRNFDEVDAPYPFTLEEKRRVSLQTQFDSNGTEIFDLEVHEFDDSKESYQYISKESKPTYPYISNLRSRNCYAIDTKSNLGTLVWIGNESGSTARQGAARKAENVIKYNDVDRLAPVTYVTQEEITDELLNYSNTSTQRDFNFTPLNNMVGMILSKRWRIGNDKEEGAFASVQKKKI